MAEAAKQEQNETSILNSFVKLLPRLIISMALLAAFLFLPAGSTDWPMGWALVGAHLVYLLILSFVLLRVNPDLIKERSRLVTRDTKGWDKLLNPLLGGVLLIGWLVAGFDRRFGWSTEIALGLQVVGLVAMIAGYSLFGWSMVVNQYFSRVVRIQEDRGHSVFTGGPYRVVRHPGYAGFCVAFIGMGLALGSLWGLVLLILSGAMLVLRTALEDRTLHAELPGYPEYAQQTRYRLLPGVW